MKYNLMDEESTGGIVIFPGITIDEESTGI
jgi:hypothetical protein